MIRLEGTSTDTSRLINDKQHIGVKELAEAAKVSRGTVDRALHGRAGVDPKTRERIRSIAQSLGYQPNLAARALRKRLRLTISINLPIHLRPFFDAIRDGIHAAAHPLSSTVRLEFHDHGLLGEGDDKALTEALRSGVQGVILAPGNPETINERIFDTVVHKGIPIVCVATDIPESPRLTAVMAQPYVCGALAAELLSLATPGPGAVVVFTGRLTNFNHCEKLRGFRTKLSSSALRLESVIETRDQPQLAYQQAWDVIQTVQSLRAIYISTANSIPVIEALKTAGRVETTCIVTTDLFAELKPLIRDRIVLGTIYQNPKEQGRLAFASLYDFLSDGVKPSTVINVAPSLILSSNLDGIDKVSS